MGKPDRVLTVGQMRQVRTALAGGAKPDDLARAYAVSKRTIFRANEGRLEEGEIGGHKVVLQVRDGQAPVVVARPMESGA
jgi:hypothetical protein